MRLLLLLPIASLLTGCATFKDAGANVDNTYRKRVKSFELHYVIVPPSVYGVWNYNPPFGQFSDTYAGEKALLGFKK
jgi:hypothetical protein